MKPYYERYWDEKEACPDLNIKWNSVKKSLPKKNNFSMLDFGCGKGVLTKKIIDIKPNVVLSGLDISKSAVSYCKKKFPQGTFHNIKDGERFPFEDNSFDYVIAADVLEHVYDTEVVFSELCRVMKPGGTLYASVPYHGRLKNLVFIFLAFDAFFSPTQPHIRFFTVKNFKYMLEKAGFEISKFGYYGRMYPLSHAMYAYCTKNRSKKTSV